MFRRRRQKRRAGKAAPHYEAHKELARSIITERVDFWNGHYNFSYNRIAIRNQRRCWGSCSAKKNLNFNYRLIFLPEELMDYIVVHELCHLEHLNHGKDFWNTVGRAMPEYAARRAHLRRITSVPARGFPSSVMQKV